MANLSVNTVARFWSKVDVGRDSECWNWRGGMSNEGYGRFRFNDRLCSPHRVAYELANGDIPEGEGYHGMVVMHRCDNRACCNPSHLRLGTQGDNVQDMDAKGRRVCNPNVIIPEEVVLAIIQDPRPHRLIAQTYGVSKTHVGALKRGDRRSPKQTQEHVASQ